MALVLLFIFVTAAQAGTQVIVDGKTLTFAAPPVVEKGRILVPLRAIFEALNAKVNWDQASQTVTATRDNTNIRLVIGGQAYKNDQAVALDVPAKLAGGTTLVPLRFVSEALGAKVDWHNGVVTITSAGTPETSSTSDVSNISDAAKNPQNAAMGVSFRLFNQLRQTQDLQGRNIMFSPFSLQMAFMMLANGAEGKTQQEILNTFGVNDLAKYNDTAKTAIQTLNADQAVNFNVANSIWLNKDYYPGDNVDLTSQFKSDMQNYFSANAAAVNKANGAKTINDWISKETNNKINNVLTDGDMQELLLCLVNTIYFKADWQAPFKAEGTAKAPFTEPNGQVKQTDFMHQTGYFNYYEDAAMQMLEMPYQGGNVSMYVILPKEGSPGFANVNANMVATAIANKSQQYVNVMMPKFKTETSMKLNDAMKALGITTAFDESCPDLTDKLVSGLPAGNNVFISLVMQKSFIQVDEKGTEAAAATVIGMTGAGMPPEQMVVFNANRPFMYLIRNNTGGDIYFMGQYSFVR